MMRCPPVRHTERIHTNGSPIPNLPLHVKGEQTLHPFLQDAPSQDKLQKHFLNPKGQPV